MPLQKYSIKWSIIIITALAVGLLFFWETNHLKIETDILESMPHHDPVLNYARQVIHHLPIQDKIFIDLEQASDNRDELVKAASVVTDKLNKSGLFTRVGISDAVNNFPELLGHVNSNLPWLLSASDLEQKIQPLLEPGQIRKAMTHNRQSLEQLEGIGRSEMMASDPLGFAGVILGQMSALLPAGGAQFYSGQLLSGDGRHALIVARIAGSGTDTSKAARIDRLLEECREELNSETKAKGSFTLTSVGAYRAALDNETAAKRDTRLAIFLTTLGIALLLIFAFPRPLIGLLALLPSAVGAIAALFVCSFLFESMSMLAVGFGGAIMAFTVDLGITYLLFLDQPYATYGKQVAREVRSAELTAISTTIGAFLLLLISDFKILAEIGVFAALGVAFAFAFVHFVFPKIFPSMPPAARTTNPFLLDAIVRISSPAKWKAIAAALFGLTMLFFAKPVFNVDLQAMNSVSKDTIRAEQKLQGIWGDLSGRCYVLLQAPDLEALQEKNDRLMTLLAADVREEKLAPVFSPSVLFPSEKPAQKNYEAWRGFWSQERLARLELNLNAAARENGFTADAFDPFWKMIHQNMPRTFEIPQKYFEMLGISATPEGYTQLTLLGAGKNYRAENLFGTISSAGIAKLFDADLFNKKMGEFLKSLFVEIALIVSLGLVVVISLFFLDWRLSLTAIAPVVFALLATLGTLKIIGHPLDIPGIMLWIVIMGMGIDYCIYYIRTYQRCFDDKHPAMRTIRLAIFLSASTTLIGFGVLMFASHELLKSIGIVSFLGIGYSLIGTLLIIPFLLEKIFAPVPDPAGKFVIGSKEHIRRTLLRYRHLPGYPRVFARCKMMADPMFKELDQYVKNPRRIIDIGCGFGIPAAWLLEIYPGAKVFGLEPDEERVLIANRAIGQRGFVQAGLAPDLPSVDGSVDYVTMLDMLHYINDEELRLVLGRINKKLETGGTLVIRATVPSDRKFPWKRWIEMIRLKLTNTKYFFRQEKEIAGLMLDEGFTVDVQASTAIDVEEKWFVGKKS
ncbi:MAG TPA: methyltransferase domain-containing protein [Smithellaceae bacterium]|nr:methyltransferase domain-containing protein [Smithellaceae bacterium]HPL65493.1 methyltransferase domain-containing protein [Smithellaceae bacterium]